MSDLLEQIFLLPDMVTAINSEKINWDYGTSGVRNIHINIRL